MAAKTPDVDVCVVGAGPTGLMAANWLERLGVDALIVDGKAGPTRESRALGVQSRTMEIYAQLGVIGEVLAQAVRADEVHLGLGHAMLGSVAIGQLGRGITPYPGLHILEQSANEEILASRLADRGLGVRWNHRLVSARQDAEGVDLVLERQDEEPMRIRARYVIAADGASSVLRGMFGAGFPGTTNPQYFYVIDAGDVTGPGTGINVRAGARDFMLGFPMSPPGSAARRARLLGILRGDDDGGAGPDPDADGAEDRARTSLDRDFGIRYGDSAWFATYRVHHRVADAFRAGRIFLAGDAGHVHSPVGAQGMNTGLQDAHNLACKLADVLAGRMPESFLDRYEAERRPVAVKLVSTTDRLFAAVISTTPLARLLRTRLLPLVGPVVLRFLPRGATGGRLFGYLSQIRIHYWMTDADRRRAETTRGLARRHRRGRVLGRRLPWIGGVRPGEDNHEPLADATWQVHAYGRRAAALGAKTASRHALPLHRFGAAPSVGLPDGTVVVVRPDMFVAAVEHARRAPRRGAARDAGRRDGCRFQRPRRRPR